jgi:hypothetical protein
MDLHFYTGRDNYENDTPQMTINTSGNVGIGTTNPGYKLDVHGTSNVGALTATTGAFSSNLGVGTANLFVDTTTGNVGVGTTTPGYPLDVHGTANVGALTTTSVSGDGSALTGLNATNVNSGTISRPVDTTGDIKGASLYTDEYIYHDGDTNTNISFPAADTVAITTAGGERMRINSSGNVGIGTTNPQYKLDVNVGTDIMLRLMASANASGKLIFGRSGSSDIRSHAIESYNSSGSQNNYMKFLVHDGTGISPYETRTDVMTLRGDGNVGIGVTDPSYKLDVHGSSNVGALTTTSVSGNGSGLTTLNAGNITSGTISKDRLPTTLNNTTIQHGASAFLTIHDSTGDNQAAVIYQTDSFTWKAGLHAASTKGDFKISKDDFSANEYFVIQTDGKIGIGTELPGYTLDVHGTSNVGALTATSLSGDGSGLTSLDAGNISSGTIDKDRLPTTLNNTTIGSLAIGANDVTLTAKVNYHGLKILKAFDHPDEPATLLLAGDGDVGDDIAFEIRGNGTGADVDTTTTRDSDDTTFGILHTGHTYIGYPNLNPGETGGNAQNGDPMLNVSGDIYATGNVGIGTASPGYKLDVHGTSNVGALTATSLSGDGSGLSALNASNVSSGTLGRPISTSTGVFTSTGNAVLVGTNGKLGLTINDGDGNCNLTFNHASVVPDQNGSSGRIDCGVDGTTGYMRLRVKSSVTGGTSTGNLPECVRIEEGYVRAYSDFYADGNVGIGTGSPSYKLDVAGDIYATGNITAYSDRRAKSDIQKIENALDKIDQLNGYTFTMNDKRYTGVIAQEVLPVLPEAVTGSEETNYAVAYGNMMGLIIEAIKELKEKMGNNKHGPRRTIIP